MKLNTKDFRYLSTEDWRVLQGCEIGSRNHELVPTPLIVQLSGLRAGSAGATRSISTLAKAGLIAKVKNAKYDGYRLTYGGLDYLALHAHTKSGAVLHLGSNRTATGKESDIYLVTTPSTSSASAPTNPNLAPQRDQAVFKIHRLGRISFRTLKNNRAYHGNRSHATWQHLSRLSAQKEFSAMRALHAAGFPVPWAIAWNRHTIVMSLVPGLPLTKVPLSAFGKEGTKEREENLAALYGKLMELTLKLAEVGVIHGDFNEFNLLVENVPEPEDDEEDEEEHGTGSPALEKATAEPRPSNLPPMVPHLIDFPQITSFAHPQARFYYDRDVECVKRFFRKRYHFVADNDGPKFEEAQARLEKAEKARVQGSGLPRLDVEVEAAGFSKKMAKELEGYFDASGRDIEAENDPESRDDEEESEEDEVVDEVEQDATGQVEAHPNAGEAEEDEPFDLMASIRDAQGYDDTVRPMKQESLAPKLAALDLNTKGPGALQQKKSKKAAGWAI